MRIFSHTDCALNDKVYRLKRKIQSRIDYAEQRCDYSNIEQSQKVGMFCARARVLLSRLVNNKLQNQHIEYKEVYNEVKNWPPIKEHMFLECGIEPKVFIKEEMYEQSFLDMFEKGTKRGAIKRMEDRLEMQMIESYRKGHAMVFSTLTVKPEKYQEVFSTDSLSWRNFIRSIKATIVEGEFHYFAVVEKSSSGRLHVHVMMFIEKLRNISDPNYGMKVPTLREIDISRHWPYGFTQAIPVRFNGNDYYGKRKWCWPVDPNTKEPIEGSVMGKITTYMSKYLVKTLEEKEQRWKIKTDRQLGLVKLREVMRKMSEYELRALCIMRKYPKKIKIYGKERGNRLIRQNAVKEMIGRLMTECRQPESLVLSKSMTFRQLLRNMTPKRQECRQLNSIGAILEFLSGLDISDEDMRNWYGAYCRIVEEMPTLRVDINRGSPERYY